MAGTCSVVICSYILEWVIRTRFDLENTDAVARRFDSENIIPASKASEFWTRTFREP